MGDLVALALAFLMAGMASLLLEEEIFHKVSDYTVNTEARARVFQFLVADTFGRLAAFRCWSTRG